jgi:hypothetical protein
MLRIISLESLLQVPTWCSNSVSLVFLEINKKYTYVLICPGMSHIIRSVDVLGDGSLGAHGGSGLSTIGELLWEVLITLFCSSSGINKQDGRMS